MNRTMNLPQSLKTQVRPTSTTMKIESSVLDPQTISNTRCVFQLERKGILDAGSILQIGIRSNEALSELDNFLPLNTGAFSFIKTARLFCGVKCISTMEDIPYYNQCKELFKSNEERYNKSSVKLGTNSVIQPDNEGSGRMCLKDVTNRAYNAPQRNTIPNNDETTPLYTIKLSELFPMCRGLQLPLYLIEQPISIHLEFNTQLPTENNSYRGYGNMCLYSKNIISAERGNPKTKDLSVVISQDNVKFIADYLTYDDETMTYMFDQNAGDGMVMPYEDLIVTRQDIAPAQGTAITEQTLLIAISGRTCRNILVHCHMDQSVDASESTGFLDMVEGLQVNPLLGAYASMSPPVPMSYNIRVNDNSVYPRNLNLPSQQYGEVTKAMGVSLNCNTATYSFDSIIDFQEPATVSPNPILSSTEQFMEYNENIYLSGTNYILGLDLSKSNMNTLGNGTFIEKPIEMRVSLPQLTNVKQFEGMTNTLNFNKPRTFRFFSAVERVLTIKNGLMTLSN